MGSRQSGRYGVRKTRTICATTPVRVETGKSDGDHASGFMKYQPCFCGKRDVKVGTRSRVPFAQPRRTVPQNMEIPRVSMIFPSPLQGWDIHPQGRASHTLGDIRPYFPYPEGGYTTGVRHAAIALPNLCA